jgi:hypothetical protein
MIEDIFCYQIEVKGKLAGEDLQTFSPKELVLEPSGEDNTRLILRTDQAGMIGLIRSLHGLGFVILLVNTRQS